MLFFLTTRNGPNRGHRVLHTFRWYACGRQFLYGLRQFRERLVRVSTTDYQLCMTEAPGISNLESERNARNRTTLCVAQASVDLGLQQNHLDHVLHTNDPSMCNHAWSNVKHAYLPSRLLQLHCLSVDLNAIFRTNTFAMRTTSGHFSRAEHSLVAVRYRALGWQSGAARWICAEGRVMRYHSRQQSSRFTTV